MLYTGSDSGAHSRGRKKIITLTNICGVEYHDVIYSSMVRVAIAVHMVVRAYSHVAMLLKEMV